MTIIVCIIVLVTRQSKQKLLLNVETFAAHTARKKVKHKLSVGRRRRHRAAPFSRDPENNCIFQGAQFLQLLRLLFFIAPDYNFDVCLRQMPPKCSPWLFSRIFLSFPGIFPLEMRDAAASAVAT